jgi:hypothetical protein
MFYSFLFLNFIPQFFSNKKTNGIPATYRHGYGSAEIPFALLYCNKNIHKHYVPLFPFTHPAHNENVRRLRAIVSPGNRLMFSVINRIGKEQKCAALQNGHRPAKICRETLHDQHLPYSFLIYGRDTDAVSHKKHQSVHKLI